MEAQSNNEFLTVNELARKLKVSLNTVYYWTSRREIPFVKVGRHLRFNLAAVVEAFNKRIPNPSGYCGELFFAVNEPSHCSLKTRGTGQADSSKRNQKYGNN